MLLIKLAIGLLLGWLFIVLSGGIHKIDEGHVGVYYIGGILQKQVSSPGYNFLTPLLTSYRSVQITVQTDVVTNIPCGTSSGVMIYFDKVEVVNRLKRDYVYDTIKNYTTDYDRPWIYDKIHHEINQFCTTHTLREVYIDTFDTLDESLANALQKDCEIWAPGIEIIAIRITKPIIPERIKKNFEMMEGEKTRLLIVSENQKLKIQEAETEKKQQIIKAGSLFEVSKINIEREIQEQLNKQRLSNMENENYLLKKKKEADAQYYLANKQLETDIQRLSDKFLMNEAVNALTNNLRLQVGDNIPIFIALNEDEIDILASDMIKKKGEI